MTHYNVTLADGREFVIEADGEDTARRRGRDFGSRVVSVEEAETPAGFTPTGVRSWQEPDPQE